MAGIVGTWEHVTSENLDAYMDALSVPEQARNMMKEQKKTLVIENEGDTWTVTAKIGEMNNVVSLKVGEMGSYKTFTGEDMQGIIKSVGDKMQEEHTIKDTKIEVTREVVNGQLCLTLCVKGVTAKMIYNRK